MNFWFLLLCFGVTSGLIGFMVALEWICPRRGKGPVRWTVRRFEIRNKAATPQKEDKNA